MIYLGTGMILDLHTFDYYYDTESSKILAFNPTMTITSYACDFEFSSNWSISATDTTYYRDDIPGTKIVNTNEERDDIIMNIILNKIYDISSFCDTRKKHK